MVAESASSVIFKKDETSDTWGVDFELRWSQKSKLKKEAKAEDARCTIG